MRKCSLSFAGLSCQPSCTVGVRFILQVPMYFAEGKSSIGGPNGIFGGRSGISIRIVLHGGL